MFGFKPFVFVSLSVALLSACSSGTVVTGEGTADKLIWPDPVKDIRFEKGKGIYPNPVNLEKVYKGATKSQLYYLLGTPHFDEGLSAREWDYVFYFPTPGVAQGVTTCQYKVLFDKQKIARSFYWKAVEPADAVCPPGVK
ncbi:outer membrane protein assembly factor BamE (lipoprotein component of BamABCDE complex) [Mesocricetibacter intestinalis]|uniref:Outer membrane protein assembly factor BamE (Lipoprotein component of BamABCDE complex) n=1 Tax=Mesocricetibacter intestinalis TaxID=1521930 RepID=A0A4R6VG27_9PAST|nr:outer membrane protein assembly factor BamE [Mesocricetibacter intestinalis]TDQ59751.1 outer membrane protein assembly factor BamE (lipoprotein component of BamABCDE complex) [Mesocricetibacter intestinalis]